MTDWYLPKVLRHLTEQCLDPSRGIESKQLQFTRSSIQSEVATVEEFVQMMNTLQGQQHVWNHEISRLTAGYLQFRQAGSPGWRRLRLRLDKQFRQRFLMQSHDQMNEKVRSTSKALGNFERSKENL